MGQNKSKKTVDSPVEGEEALKITDVSLAPLDGILDELDKRYPGCLVVCQYQDPKCGCWRIGAYSSAPPATMRGLALFAADYAVEHNNELNERHSNSKPGR